MMDLIYPDGLAVATGGKCFPLVLAPEESPDWTGRPAVESTDGSNLMNAVTEHRPPEKGKGETARQELTTPYGDMRR